MLEPDALELLDGKVTPWQPGGAPIYTRHGLTATWSPDDACRPRFFWKTNPAKNDEHCLSQWQPSRFTVAGAQYTTAEQYMMATKARIFDDADTLAAIMATNSPHAVKALGRQVRHFDDGVWKRVRYTVVLDGNYAKFSQNPAMLDFLLSTGDALLVEASPVDTIWGIGLSADDRRALDPHTWRGQNLLGFALMEVRDRLHREHP